MKRGNKGNVADDVEMAVEQETVDELDDVPEVGGHADGLLLHDLLGLWRREKGEGTVDWIQLTRYGQSWFRPSSVCSWWNTSVFSSSGL